MSVEPTASAPARAEGLAPPRSPRRPGRAAARNTAIFSILTGLSRIAGLVREIVASSYFATSGAFSAFTIAFQLPNVVRSLFADAALSAAFVPVFTELLEHGQAQGGVQARLDAVLPDPHRARAPSRCCSSLFAGVIMPLFVGAELSQYHGPDGRPEPRPVPGGGDARASTGSFVGILNAYDHFTIPALSPLVWNAVILFCLVGSQQVLTGEDQLYGYAIGVLVGTVVQFAMALPMLRRLGFHLEVSFSFARPARAPGPAADAAGDDRARAHQLQRPHQLDARLAGLRQTRPARSTRPSASTCCPRAMFSVAIATVLFPALSRFAARRDYDGLRALIANGMRQIFLLLVPAAAATLALSEPITRLIYEHGRVRRRARPTSSRARSSGSRSRCPSAA